MKRLVSLLCLAMLQTAAFAQSYTVSSPDGHIKLNVDNAERLTYSFSLDGTTLIAPSPMGFSFMGEPDMGAGFEVTGDDAVKSGVEAWTPVVRQKHDHCNVAYNELTLRLKEKESPFRRMDVSFRAMDGGIAFRYTLYGIPVLGDRQITRELTGYSVPGQSSLWIPGFESYDEAHPYRTAQEGEFVQTPVTEISTEIHAGLPGLIKVDDGNWMAIMEAYIDNFPAFYLGRSGGAKDGWQMLDTKLTPIYGENEDGVKARFDEEISSPWRVILAGHNPGEFIGSEIVNALNPECAIEDPSWIKPGISAWDNWWSGDIKMEQDTIKKYIDFASAEGWPYMLIDWTWYGPYNVPQADITKPAPQLDMPGILDYAKSKNVGIWLWLRCEDANNNDQYKAAFPLYHQWGVKGVKIDFMDRDDQDMTRWYRRIVKAAADNELMVDFHGAYAPDGIERTWPNLLTREGVLGAEHYKWSYVSPEHNVKLAYTRMLAGPMDYTPGGFLNVTKEQFKPQVPTLVANTRAAELAKLVVYESPFLCFCDSPDNVYGQTGEDFIRRVKAEWDDTRFLGGTPDSYVALAHRSGDEWFIGVLNNSEERNITIDLSSFLSSGDYSLEYWQDGKKAARMATDCEHKSRTISSDKALGIHLAPAGGYVAIIKAK